MALVHYLEYNVHLTNKAQVDALQAAYPNGLRLAPATAAVTYLAPIQLESANFSAPCCRSQWFVVTGGQNFPVDQASFTRHTGGWFGISLLFGDTHVYRWIAKFVYSTGGTPEINGTPTEVVAIAQRKAIIGWELPPGGEQTSLSFYSQLSRDSSRHPDGFGMSYRDQGDQSQIIMTAHVAANADTWERIYFRPRKAPTLGPGLVWTGGGSSSNAALLRYTTDGRLALYGLTSSVIDTLFATTSDSYAIDTWIRLDILTHCNGTTGGWVEVYVNRNRVINRVTFANGIALSNVATHTASFIGGGNTNDTLEFDVDDYTAAAHPTQDSGGRFTGIDWLNGTKIQKVDVTALGAGNGWLGDYRMVQQHHDAFHADAGSAMTSIVSADALVFDMSTKQITAQVGSLGCISFLACWYVQQTVSIAGSAATFGWRFDGLLDLLGIALTVNNLGWISRMYRPAGLTEPIADLTPIELHHIKYGNVSPANVQACALLVELVGTFGAEDVPEDTAETVTPATIPPRRGIHASSYPDSIWARTNTPPVSPVIVHSGTYVGNGTVQELQFRAPVTWMVIKRENAATAGGFFWHTGQVGGHDTGARYDTEPTVRAMIDPSFVPTGVENDQEQRCVVRIVGDNTSLNVVGNTYNYIAFIDPGARFSLNGGFSHGSNTTTFNNILRNSQFLADAIFAQIERIGSSDTTTGMYFAGPGTVGTAAHLLSGSTPASIGTIVAGQFVSVAGNLHSDANTNGYSAFRMDDQSTDPNKHKILRVGTYTGDGTASRTISWAPSGLRPLYAIVAPANAAWFHRTPSNTGTTSHNMSTGASIAATGITAGGIDSMAVGSLGNSNGIVYNWFVILGSATAGNGGWSIDGEFIYVAPDTPEDIDEYDDPEDSEDPDEPEPDPDPDEGEDDGDDCEAGEVCVLATTREVNRALLEIGNTKFLSNYCTQQTLEAQTARLLYESSVRAVLHAFPWPFATKYAALALTTAQPANQDWAFSYRQPVDCIFERRISVARSGAIDPVPPAFELSADSSGGLIFTNEPNAVLEYTCRPACVAFNGDALFLEALKWHLASAMAPPLTRMKDMGPECYTKYEKCIAKANAIVRPDDPGLRVAASFHASDVGAGAMAANVEVANLALVKIGATTIANLTTDQSREAAAVNLVFEHELQAVLRDYSWKFAKRYNDALVLVGGTDTVPVNPDWQYSFRLPADCVMVRRLPTTGTGRSFERYPNPFEVGTDATGGLLFTNVMTDQLNLEYTARIANAVLRSDHLFREALGWRLAAALAPSLAALDPERHEQFNRGPEHAPDPEQRVSLKPNKAALRERMQRWAFAQYLNAIAKARMQDANEAEPEPHGDAEWIEGRS